MIPMILHRGWEVDPTCISQTTHCCSTSSWWFLLQPLWNILILVKMGESSPNRGDNKTYCWWTKSKKPPRMIIIPLFYKVFNHPRWLFGISEPSTVSFKTTTIHHPVLFFFIAKILGTWMPGTSCARPTKENIFTTSAHSLKAEGIGGWLGGSTGAPVANP